MTEERVLHRKLSFDVVGCAQRVHRALGPGFPEVVYRRALCYELMDRGIPFESEKPLQVFYNDKLAGEFRVDLLVDGLIILELKALSGLTNDHVAQTLSYLKASGLRLAILMNFGSTSLQTQRVVR